MNKIKLKLPTKIDKLKELKSGDFVLLSGTVYTVRDEAHRKMQGLKDKGQEIPINLNNQIIYYCGPAPSKPGQIINSAGPTTAKRMDPYTDLILELGVIGMIGKGERSEETRSKLGGKAVYLATFGGIAAKLAKYIKSNELLAFEELGMEAIRKLELVDFPAIVINDLEANDYYDICKSKRPDPSGSQ